MHLKPATTHLMLHQLDKVVHWKKITIIFQSTATIKSEIDSYVYEVWQQGQHQNWSFKNLIIFSS